MASEERVRSGMQRETLFRERIKKIEKLEREFWFILKVKTGSPSNG